MSAKTLLVVLATAVLAATGGYFLAKRQPVVAPSTGAVTPRRVMFYQSPMHPWIKSDKPGKCTICGMDLVPVYEGEAAKAGDAGLVMLSSASASVTGVQSTEIATGTWVKTIRVTGVLDDDETKHRVVSAHLSGRIEKLFVNQVGAHVAAGEPLALMYSPEIQTAQRQYVERVRAGANAFTASERADARERLLAMGMLPAEITNLEETLQPAATVTVYAHAGGTIITRSAYEGQYVETHDKLFEVGDFSTLWFIFDAYEADLASLRVGQTVEVSTPSRPDEPVVAPIAFIDPNINEANRTARVRVVVDNAGGRFLHRQTATGRVRVEVPDTLLVPRAAVLHTREVPVVFVDKSGGAYEPRTVKLGRAGDTFYEMLGGVKAGERVVTEGALMLDGQAQLAHGATASNEHASEGAKHEETKSAAPMKTDASASMPRADLEPVALAVADLSAALASDDFAGFQKLLPTLSAALKSTTSVSAALKTIGEKLTDAADLKAARRAFEPFSTALADLAKEAHLHHRGVVKIFQCPMSPVLGTGRWLQRGGELRNPFFGSAMLECGEAIE